jgi:hypothetical protein
MERETEKLKFTLPRAVKAQTGLYPFLNLGIIWDGLTQLPGRFIPGYSRVPIVRSAGWAPGPVWTDRENLVLTGIRSPDRPARN